MSDSRFILAGVMGWPVAHSRSPAIHNHWIAQYGLRGTYVTLPVQPEHLPEAVRGLRALGFAGCNVTVPHKVAAMAHMDEIDALVSGFTAQYTKEDLFALLMKHRVACAPVRSLDEVINDEHMHERRALQWVDHPLYGRVCLPNSPMRYDASEPLHLKPSGELGRDNEAVYCEWLGLSSADYAQLVAEEVI